MLHSTKAKALSAVCFTLLLLLCTSGGCMRAPHRGFSGCGPNCLFPLQGWLGRCDPVCVVDPVCYGYDATCWEPWPQQCEGCPLDHMQQIETEASVSGQQEGSAADGSHPTLAPKKPDSSDPNAADWDLLPVPDSTAGEGNDEAASPPQRDQGNAVYSPFREDEARSGEDGDAAPLPETKNQTAPEIEDLPPQPPIEDGTTFKTGTSTLRFASFSEPEAIAPRRPRLTSHVTRAGAGAPKQNTPNQNKSLSELPKPPRGCKSPALEHQERLRILEAIRLSFLSPAPRVPPGKVKNARMREADSM